MSIALLHYELLMFKLMFAFMLYMEIAGLCYWNYG